VFKFVAATAYVASLLYVPAAVVWATRTPGAARAPARMRAVAAAVSALVVYAVFSAVQVVAGVLSWPSAAIGFVLVAVALAAWVRWSARFSSPQ
jgi:protein-S-isoprenylcysteine O-methyltransferase Ste14